MSDIDYQLDGGVLASIPGVKLLSSSDGMVEATVNDSFIDVAGRDGVTQLPTPPTYGAREMDLVFRVMGKTASDIRVSVARLQSLLVDTRRVTRVWAGATTTADVVLKRLAKPEVFDPAALVIVTATYLVPGVFWLGTPVTLTPTVTTSQVPTAVDSPVTGMGGAVSNLVATFIGPLTYVRVIDAAYGTWVEWTGTVPTGQKLVLNMGASNATLNGVPVPGGLSAHPLGGRFIPTGGVLRLAVIRTGGQGTVTITYSPTFF